MMVEYEKILSLEFYNYKGVFSGSLQGMRYRIKRTGDEPDFKFLVHVWKEPYSFEATPKEEMEEKEFEFSEDGKKELVDWINHTYEEKYQNKK